MTGVGAALNTAKVTPGLVGGRVRLRGVGISAIQGARVAGAAEIVAVDLVESKLADAQRFGATHAVKPATCRPPGRADGGDGFDFAFEAIGLPDTMRAAYDATRRGGTTCIIGVGGLDKMVTFSAFELFYTEKTLEGSYYGSADVRDRLQPHAQPVAQRPARPRGHDHQARSPSTTSTRRSPTCRPARSSARSSRSATPTRRGAAAGAVEGRRRPPGLRRRGRCRGCRAARGGCDFPRRRRPGRPSRSSIRGARGRHRGAWGEA